MRLARDWVLSQVWFVPNLTLCCLPLHTFDGNQISMSTPCFTLIMECQLDFVDSYYFISNIHFENLKSFYDKKGPDLHFRSFVLTQSTH